jgi:hypothetical protein
MYEFKYRMDDQQIGRFWQVDPIAVKFVYNSIYAFSENKVTAHIELEGKESIHVDDVNLKYTPNENLVGPIVATVITLVVGPELTVPTIIKLAPTN